MISEITAKSILRTYKKIDSWFIARYGLNLYRGCTHDCVYCDGRAEKYQVGLDFGSSVQVKVNAPELLNRALNPERKRKPLKNGFVVLGGGVGDSYQSAEIKYQLARKCLEVFLKYQTPVHLITKSDLILRDIDLIKKLSQTSKVLVSFSFSMVDDELANLLEPCASLPSKRLNAIRKFKAAKIPVGVLLLPVIPGITDTTEKMEESLAAIKNAGADWMLFGGMTLKPGRQKQHFYDFLQKYNPDFVAGYDKIYKDNKWGGVSSQYYRKISDRYQKIYGKYHMPKWIAPKLYDGNLDVNEKIALIFEQMDHTLKSQNKVSPFGYAAYQISKLKVPISEMMDNLKKIPGVGPYTVKVIHEILETGTCSKYDELLAG